MISELKNVISKKCHPILSLPQASLQYIFGLRPSVVLLSGKTKQSDW